MSSRYSRGAHSNISSRSNSRASSRSFLPTAAQRSNVHNTNSSGTVRRREAADSEAYRSASDSADLEDCINVIIRVRGRNEKEVKENCGISVSTFGALGTEIAIQSDSSSVLSAKTYTFDRVFGPEADQILVFEDSVSPVLNQVLSGFNCTIFAYGQTGTGKTYTMTGDLNDSYGMLPDGAGMIPRTLYMLFSKLETDFTEFSVKCSFYELYNEEIRDLLVTEDSRKPARVFEDISRKGNVVITGMEECYIKDAADGVRLLREGSHRRQVAATRCNDLSSRSHSIFTITVHARPKRADPHDDTFRLGKLHMVDLAGSENIGRSGAENKRARETGMINQSLLTLGRVINALVEKSQHIPYRESKLTRLLQDSLGGKTKTSMIVTVSPASSNLEETLSTLEYANRARSIRNRPQNNQLILRKILIKDLVIDIERLKADLTATRQKNGVYLTTQTYKELTDDVESKKLLCQEQTRKIEYLETNLKHSKEQLQTAFKNAQDLKKQLEQNSQTIQDKSDALEAANTKIALLEARLADEVHLREAYAQTEIHNGETAEQFSKSYHDSKQHISALHDKLARSEQAGQENQHIFRNLQYKVLTMVRGFQGKFCDSTSNYFSLLNNLNTSMEELLNNHTGVVKQTNDIYTSHMSHLDSSIKELLTTIESNSGDQLSLAENVQKSREAINQQLSMGLQEIDMASQKISNDISSNLLELKQGINGSFGILNQELKSLFEELDQYLEQQAVKLKNVRDNTVTQLEKELSVVSAKYIELRDFMEQNTSILDVEKNKMMESVNTLISQMFTEQQTRLQRGNDLLNDCCSNMFGKLETIGKHISSELDSAIAQKDEMGGNVSSTKETLKKVILDASRTADAKSKTIQSSSHAVYDQCVSLAAKQQNNMAQQNEALDAMMKSVLEKHNNVSSAVSSHLQTLLQDAQVSHAQILDHFKNSTGGMSAITELLSQSTTQIANQTNTLIDDGGEALNEIDRIVRDAALTKSASTGQTPQNKYILTRQHGHAQLKTLILSYQCLGRHCKVVLRTFKMTPMLK
ncbi:kinesin-like protein Cut7 [Schizosaccharomyces japonicus yFS275]|uniref:Kinesin-like protein Cut7 n=1 Tax=Schizosaccharomyces japonicus (strain yFS275 / FY16936) TaxID=402676 RepID=B6K7M9_SCHJY|nr:kinesin-like protein Cut7 [Schizosaccharomyces japonicus yFS275]EEB09533.2 kinesin-like protein Cut7 [Schizosaccharomyces japonicus yFS275]